jgi:hypothetical protein
MLEPITRLIDHHPKLLIATLTAIIGVGTIGGGLWINVSLARIEAQASLYEQQLKLEQKKFEQLWLTTKLRGEKIYQHLDSLETTLHDTEALIPVLIDQSISHTSEIKTKIQKLNSSVQKLRLQLAEAKKDDQELRKLEGVFGSGAAAGGLAVSSLLIGAGLGLLIFLAVGLMIFRNKKKQSIDVAS